MRAKAFLLFDVSAHWGVEYRGGRANRLAMSFLRLNEPPGGHPLLVPLQDVQRANICPASGRAPCERVPTGTRDEAAALRRGDGAAAGPPGSPETAPGRPPC